MVKQVPSPPDLLNWRQEILPGQCFGVHVTPKSAKDAVIGWEVDAAGQRWLGVRLRAKPAEGQANLALVALLARELAVPKRAMVLVQGAGSRYKRLRYEP